MKTKLCDLLQYADGGSSAFAISISINPVLFWFSMQGVYNPYSVLRKERSVSYTEIVRMSGGQLRKEI